MRPRKSLLEIVRNFGFAIWLLRLPHMAKLLQIFKKMLVSPQGERYLPPEFALVNSFFAGVFVGEATMQIGYRKILKPLS